MTQKLQGSVERIFGPLSEPGERCVGLGFLELLASTTDDTPLWDEMTAALTVLIAVVERLLDGKVSRDKLIMAHKYLAQVTNVAAARRLWSILGGLTLSSTAPIAERLTSYERGLRRRGHYPAAAYVSQVVKAINRPQRPVLEVCQ